MSDTMDSKKILEITKKVEEYSKLVGSEDDLDFMEDGAFWETDDADDCGSTSRSLMASMTSRNWNDGNANGNEQSSAASARIGSFCSECLAAEACSVSGHGKDIHGVTGFSMPMEDVYGMGAMGAMGAGTGCGGGGLEGSKAKNFESIVNAPLSAAISNDDGLLVGDVIGAAANDNHCGGSGGLGLSAHCDSSNQKFNLKADI